MVEETYVCVGRRASLSKHKSDFLRLIENGVDAYLLRADGVKVRDWGDYENNFADTVEATLYAPQRDLPRIRSLLQRNPAFLDGNGNLAWIAGLYVAFFIGLVQWLTSLYVSESAHPWLSAYGQYIVSGIYMAFEFAIWLKAPPNARNSILMGLIRAIFATFLIVTLLSFLS